MDALIQAAEARVRQARGGNYPAIDSYAGYEVDTGLKLGGSGDSWQAGIMLEYDLFDGHRTSSETLKALAFLAETREQKRKTELDIRLDIERARFALHEAEQRFSVTEKIVEQAKESAAINRARFKEGLVLSSDLIAGETRLTGALVRRAQAEVARSIAVADLRRALGLPQFSEPATGGHK
jgi:outer membrane protein TolC